MKYTHSDHEQVSALADGQLGGSEFDHAVDRLCAEDDLRASWHAYHLVGDVLRSGTHTPCSDSAAFLARFQQRLVETHDAEPTLVRTGGVQKELLRAEAANEPVFRWKLVAGAASLAAAAAIGWNWIGSPASPAGGAQLAQQQLSAPAASSVPATALAFSAPPPGTSNLRVVGGGSKPQVMIRDPHLDRLLEAHREAGGASQMPSGFLRNATFEGASR
ncbi:Anti-sigma factor [Burkholderiales bacterium 8X]|nr:Anti-sigma factor [Burkholderiales bacterium 8X]